MPYARNSELPEGVRDALPSSAQTVWRNVFNSQKARDLSDARAAASAWSALENQGWKKGQDGKWSKVGKSEEVDFDISGEVAKVDEEQRLAFGWASVVSRDGTPVEDSQGDVIDIEELERAAYEYVRVSRKGGEMHRWIVGKLVESLVVTPEKLDAMGLDRDCLDPGWWIGFKLDEEAFEKVKSGEYRMFSIGGKGLRTEED